MPSSAGVGPSVMSGSVQAGSSRAASTKIRSGRAMIMAGAGSCSGAANRWLLLLRGERPFAEVAECDLALHRRRFDCAGVRHGDGVPLDGSGEPEGDSVALDRAGDLLLA